MATFILSAFADEAGKELSAQIAALQRNRIGYIEPRNIGGKGILDLTDEELNATAQELSAAGIRVNSVGSPIGKYDIDKDFAPHMAQFERALTVAKRLDTRMIRMFSFFVPQAELAAHRDEVMRRLRIMLDRAAEEGITLCHENESRIYGQMPDQVADLLTTLPDLKGIFDPANYRMNGADVVRGMDVTLPSLAYMHIKDAIFDQQMIVPAGEGEGHVAESIERVHRAVDGPVFLTVEPHLKTFAAYASIDDRELKGKYVFRTSDESFDFAVNALKKVLTDLGFHETGLGKWEK